MAGKEPTSQKPHGIPADKHSHDKGDSVTEVTIRRIIIPNDPDFVGEVGRGIEPTTPKPDK